MRAGVNSFGGLLADPNGSRLRWSDDVITFKSHLNVAHFCG